MAEFNPHILLVIRWLQNKDLVTKKELDNSYNAAIEIYHAAVYAAAGTAEAAVYAAARAAYAVTEARKFGYWLTRTKERIDEYFKLTKEDRKAYEEQAKYLNVLGVNNE